MRGVVLLLLSSLAFAGEPLITLDYTGGFTPPRIHKEPFLQIFEDGTIRARNPYTKDKPREDKMSKEAVKKLAEELAPKLQELKKYPADAPAITDAATTVMRVGKKTAKQYALGFLAKELPKNKEVQALWAARERLDRIYNVAMVGGEKQAEAILKTANEALKKAWPKAKPLTLDELTSYRESATFRRQDGKRWIVIQVKDGKATVETGG